MYESYNSLPSPLPPTRCEFPLEKKNKSIIRTLPRNTGVVSSEIGLKLNVLDIFSSLENGNVYLYVGPVLRTVLKIVRPPNRTTCTYVNILRCTQEEEGERGGRLRN